jgi:hypothetical protein
MKNEVILIAKPQPRSVEERFGKVPMSMDGQREYCTTCETHCEMLMPYPKNCYHWQHGYTLKDLENLEPCANPNSAGRFEIISKTPRGIKLRMPLKNYQ